MTGRAEERAMQAASAGDEGTQGPSHSTPPYVDTHEVTIPAGRGRVWTALQGYVEHSLGMARSNPVGWLLGTDPRGGFRVVGAEPGTRLTLEGRHRFSRYQLVFDLTEEGERATTLSAHTYAAFPGLHGRTYRALVIGTGFHAVVTTHMLRSVHGLVEREQRAR